MSENITQWLGSWFGSTVLIVVFVTVVVLGDSVSSQDRSFTDADIEFFENEVRPLLVKHCLECHGTSAEKVRGGLWLTSRESILRGGDSGPAAVPEAPDESLLIESIRYEAFEMPPEGQLQPHEVDVFAEWVRRGLPDPRETSESMPSVKVDIEKGKKFWAFQPVRAVEVPDVVHKDWVRTDVDNFILAQLEQRDLLPMEDAGRSSLLRRVCFAITGLPPTVIQIEKFVGSQRSLDQDLADLIDDLLATPQFGERWGRHWLDVVRFAESSGGGRSLMFPHAWRFRDYVIDSFNRDKPIDCFIKEQIAGDLLPFVDQNQRAEQVIGAGFLTLGPTNYEQQDKELLQMEVVDEQIDTIGRALLGMTLGCARCHDHKFDPIPTRDYYALAGIFKSTSTLVDGNVSTYVTQPLATEQQLAVYDEFKKKVGQLTKELDVAKKKLEQLGGGPVKPRARVSLEKLRGVVVDNRDAKLSGKWTTSTSVPGFVAEEYIHDLSQPKGANRAEFIPTLEQGGNFEVRLAYTPGGNRASNVPVTIHHQDGVKSLRINQALDPPIEGVFVSLGTYRFEANNLSSVVITNEDTDGVVIVDAIQFLPMENEAETRNSFLTPSSSTVPTPDENAKVNRELGLAKQVVKDLDEKLKELKKKAPPAPDLAMSVRDVNTPADGNIHIRGSVRNLGDIVPRGFLSVVTWDRKMAEIPADTSGRLQLAEWIVDPAHPLTARVYVNRVWRHLFGRGIVTTPDNFGMMGQLPSHPELLDFLANKFVENNWSTKQLIKLLLLSRVFRMASDGDNPAVKLDPENRLLWKANRRRADAEVIRDSILAVSGKLDPKQGGRTIRKIEQYDLGYKFDSRRRSVYVPAFRNSILGLFEVFDMANPNLVVGNRTTSTLPTQALFFMNSPWVIEQSRAAARRLLADSQSCEERTTLAFQRILGRRPADDEVQIVQSYLRENETINEEARWAGVVQTLFSSLDFRYVD